MGSPGLSPEAKKNLCGGPINLYGHRLLLLQISFHGTAIFYRKTAAESIAGHAGRCGAGQLRGDGLHPVLARLAPDYEIAGAGGESLAVDAAAIRFGAAARSMMQRAAASRPMIVK